MGWPASWAVDLGLAMGALRWQLGTVNLLGFQRFESIFGNWRHANRINKPTPIKVLMPTIVTPRQRSAMTFSGLRLNCLMCMTFPPNVRSRTHHARDGESFRCKPTGLTIRSQVVPENRKHRASAAHHSKEQELLPSTIRYRPLPRRVLDYRHHRPVSGRR